MPTLTSHWPWLLLPLRAADADPAPCKGGRGRGMARFARYTDLMRLTEEERHDIAQAALAVLPGGARVSLFGSRVDDAKRGGDIDLLVEIPGAASADEVVRLRTLLAARLYRLMGERRIDIVLTHPDAADDRLIVGEARRQAIELVRT